MHLFHDNIIFAGGLNDDLINAIGNGSALMGDHFLDPNF